MWALNLPYFVLLPLVVSLLYLTALVVQWHTLSDPATWIFTDGHTTPEELNQVRRAGWPQYSQEQIERLGASDLRSIFELCPSRTWQVAILATYPSSLIMYRLLTWHWVFWFPYSDLILPLVFGLPQWALLGFWLDCRGAPRQSIIFTRSFTGRIGMMSVALLCLFGILVPGRPMQGQILGAVLLVSGLWMLLYMIIPFDLLFLAVCRHFGHCTHPRS